MKMTRYKCVLSTTSSYKSDETQRLRFFLMTMLYSYFWYFTDLYLSWNISLYLKTLCWKFHYAKHETASEVQLSNIDWRRNSIKHHSIKSDVISKFTLNRHQLFSSNGIQTLIVGIKRSIMYRCHGNLKKNGAWSIFTNFLCHGFISKNILKQNNVIIYRLYILG